MSAAPDVQRTHAASLQQNTLPAMGRGAPQWLAADLHDTLPAVPFTPGPTAQVDLIGDDVMGAVALHSPPGHARIPKAREKILIIEADRHVAEPLEKLLLAEGFAVEMASRGEAALAAVVASRPDAVLLDTNLPDIDGFTLCTCFRNGFDIPVIFVTARAAEADILAAFEHGADDYVSIPFNAQILLCRLKAVLRAPW